MALRLASLLVLGERVDVIVVGPHVLWAPINAKVPRAVLNDCVNAAKSLHAALCAFEMIETPDHEFFCTGIELMPEFRRYPLSSQNELASWIADVLVGAENAKENQ